MVFRQLLIRLRSVLFILGLSLTLMYCDSNQDPVIAHAKGIEVVESEFMNEYQAWLLKTGIQDLPHRRILFAKDMVVTGLAIVMARNNGIEDEPHYQQRLERVQRRLVIDLFVEQVILDSIMISEAIVRDLYTRAQSTIIARQLYARTQESADSLRTLLINGQTFQELAKVVFSDPKLRNSGGLLPPFTFDEMDPVFEDSSFVLPIGIISQPVRTPQGYFIIKVEDRFTRPIITETEFFQKRHLFEDYALRRARIIARRNYLYQQIEEAEVQFDDMTVRRLLDRITPGTPISEDGLDSSILVSFGSPRQQWTVEDFREYARFASDRQRAQVRRQEDLMDFIQGLIASELMLQDAKLLPKTKDYHDRLQDIMDRYIVQYLHRQDIPDILEEEARSYYASAPPQEFRHPAQIQLTWQLYQTKMEAELVQALNSPSDSALFHSEMLGEYSDQIFQAQEGQIVGPFQMSDQWILFQVGPQTPPRKQTFIEAKAKVISILQDKRLRENRLARYAELVSRNSLVIHEEIIRGLSFTKVNDESDKFSLK
ncbi:MAG: peptidylprolyl isomerase [Bacteroidetes bacterium]|nr:peptidylprolyl isomerase [Bacteroidota bacterium]